ncbi:MAG: hypothetical protein RML45_08505 [Acetobacteraceae bacterium]|nr:hypothetical protein [Acetobacteraceae bacterium]
MRFPAIALGAVLVASGASPVAATFPAELGGLWVAGTCAEPTELLFLTPTAWARLVSQGEQVLKLAERFDRVGAFGLAVADDAEATRLLFRPTAEGLVLRDPPAKLPDTALPGDGPDIAFRRCPSIPVPLAALHGEGLSFLVALGGIAEACGGDDGAACVDRIWAWADVSGDGGLSVAEIARLARGIAYVATLSVGTTATELGQAVAATGVGAIAGAWALLASVDYDGSGTVSREELARDRFPPPGLAGLPPAGTGARPTAGAAAITSGLGAFGAMLRDLAPLLERARP